MLNWPWGVEADCFWRACRCVRVWCRICVTGGRETFVACWLFACWLTVVCWLTFASWLTFICWLVTVRSAMLAEWVRLVCWTIFASWARVDCCGINCCETVTGCLATVVGCWIFVNWVIYVCCTLLTVKLAFVCCGGIFTNWLCVACCAIFAICCGTFAFCSGAFAICCGTFAVCCAILASWASFVWSWIAGSWTMLFCWECPSFSSPFVCFWIVDKTWCWNLAKSATLICCGAVVSCATFCWDTVFCWETVFVLLFNCWAMLDCWVFPALWVTFDCGIKANCCAIFDCSDFTTPTPSGGSARLTGIFNCFGMISWPLAVVLKVRVCGISELVAVDFAGWGNNGRTEFCVTENIKLRLRQTITSKLNPIICIKVTFYDFFIMVKMQAHKFKSPLMLGLSNPVLGCVKLKC